MVPKVTVAQRLKRAATVFLLLIIERKIRYFINHDNDNILYFLPPLENFESFTFQYQLYLRSGKKIANK